MADVTGITAELRRRIELGVRDAAFVARQELVAITTMEVHRTGRTATAWFTTEPAWQGSDSIAFTFRHDQAVPDVLWFDQGTGLLGPRGQAYVIRPHPPRRFLAFYSPAAGGLVFRRSVLHPGIRPRRFIARVIEREHMAELVTQGMARARL